MSHISHYSHLKWRESGAQISLGSTGHNGQHSQLFPHSGRSTQRICCAAAFGLHRFRCSLVSLPWGRGANGADGLGGPLVPHGGHSGNFVHPGRMVAVCTLGRRGHSQTSACSSGSLCHYWRVLAAWHRFHTTDGIFPRQQHLVLVLELGHLPCLWGGSSHRPEAGLVAPVTRVWPNSRVGRLF